MCLVSNVCLLVSGEREVNPGFSSSAGVPGAFLQTPELVKSLADLEATLGRWVLEVGSGQRKWRCWRCRGRNPFRRESALQGMRRKFQAEPPGQDYQPTAKKNMQGRKPLVKWPKSNSKEWETINTDLSLILRNIKGSAENKLEKMGDIIYNYREEKCGVKDQVRKKNMLPAPKSRRLQEIQQLVKER
ncbi:hypothetical protein N1851_007033 [Merluccius polli]|uniref:Uncharacterized protein n=1 Tax=Merluccius polli TaxID=89951 RepID=A0AA47P833_MERPO|nr:hypothetical protein N1851_007033 [Merluccius polli]